jgi:hypothetical protein
MIINFFTIELNYNRQITYFEHFAIALNHTRFCEGYIEIWHCSKYLDECIKLTTIINNKNKYNEF